LRPEPSTYNLGRQPRRTETPTTPAADPWVTVETATPGSRAKQPPPVNCAGSANRTRRPRPPVPCGPGACSQNADSVWPCDQPGPRSVALQLPCLAARTTRRLTACPPPAIRRLPARQAHTRSIQPVLADGLTRRAWDTPPGEPAGFPPRYCSRLFRRNARADSVWFRSIPPAARTSRTAPTCRAILRQHCTVITALQQRTADDTAWAPGLRLRGGPFVPGGDDNGPGYDRVGRKPLYQTSWQRDRRHRHLAAAGRWSRRLRRVTARTALGPSGSEDRDPPRRGPAGKTTEVEDPQVNHC